MWVEYSWWRIYIAYGSVSMIEYHLADSDMEMIKKEGNALIQKMGFTDIEIHKVVPSRFKQGVYVGQICPIINWGM